MKNLNVHESIIELLQFDLIFNKENTNEHKSSALLLQYSYKYNNNFYLIDFIYCSKFWF